PPPITPPPPRDSSGDVQGVPPLLPPCVSRRAVNPDRDEFSGTGTWTGVYNVRGMMMCL
ncbi:hypothetical protein NHX12_012564, partial [Muraenolepis orangiensis]